MWKGTVIFYRFSSHCEKIHCCTGWQPHLLLFSPNNYFNVFKSGSVSGGSISTLWPLFGEGARVDRTRESVKSDVCQKKIIQIKNDDSTLFLSNLSIPKVAFQNEIPLPWSFPNNLSRFCLLRAKRLAGIKISFVHTLIYITVCTNAHVKNIKRKLCRSN